MSLSSRATPVTNFEIIQLEGGKCQFKFLEDNGDVIETSGEYSCREHLEQDMMQYLSRYHLKMEDVTIGTAS